MDRNLINDGRTAVELSNSWPPRWGTVTPPVKDPDQSKRSLCPALASSLWTLSGRDSERIIFQSQVSSRRCIFSLGWISLAPALSQILLPASAISSIIYSNILVWCSAPERLHRASFWAADGKQPFRRSEGRWGCSKPPRLPNDRPPPEEGDKLQLRFYYSMKPGGGRVRWNQLYLECFCANAEPWTRAWCVESLQMFHQSCSRGIHKSRAPSKKRIVLSHPRAALSDPPSGGGGESFMLRNIDAPKVGVSLSDNTSLPNIC